MNALGKKLGLTNSHFGNSQRLARRGADLCHRARPRDAGPGDDRAPSQALQAILRPAELHLGQDAGLGPGDHPGQPQPDPRQGAGADGLKTGHTDEAGYGFTGSAEQNGRRLVMVVAGLDSWNQRIEESVRLMSGASTPGRQAAVQAGRQGRHARRSSSAATSEVTLVAPRNLAVTMPAGLAGGQTKLKIRYQGPVKAPIAKGQHVADLVVTDRRHRRRRSMPLVAGEAIGEAGFFGRIWLGFKQLSGWREPARGQFISLEGGEGAGKSTQVAGARRSAARARHRRARSPASRAAAPAPRRSASCC